MTADTSAIVAALSEWHEQHDAASRALEDVTALPAHAGLEAFSVLTRLPGGLAVPPVAAADVLTRRFPDAPLRLDARAHRRLVARLAAADVMGGAVYDGLVGLEAQAHGQTLLTLDLRALRTYARLGIDAAVLS